jgi:autotransporter-associated beta strand protein
MTAFSAVLLTLSAAKAGSYTQTNTNTAWDTTGAGWTAGALWDSANGQTNTANFTNTGSAIISVATNVYFSNAVYSATSGSSLTLTNGTLTQIGGNYMSIGAGDSITIYSTLGQTTNGTGQWQKIGTGSLTLASSNNFITNKLVGLNGGTTYVTASYGVEGQVVAGSQSSNVGTVIFNGANTTNYLGNNSGVKSGTNTGVATMVITNGAVVDATGATYGAAGVLAVGGTGVANSAATVTNMLVLATNGTLKLGALAFVNGAGQNEVNIFTNAGGTLTLTNYVTQGAGTNELNEYIQTGGTLGTATAFNLGGGVNVYSGVTNQVIAAGSSTISLSAIGIGGTGTNVLNQLIVTNSGLFTITNVISMGAGSNVGVSSFTNQIILAGGTLVSAGMSTNANEAGVTNQIIFNGGTLKASASSSNFISSNINVSLASGGGTIDTGANNITNSAVIGGSGSLAKAGSGTLALAAANTYSGSTVINGGQLTLANASALGNTTNSLNVAAGILNNTNSITLGAVTLGNGSITGSGTITGSSYTASNTTLASIANTLAGSGVSFTQSGAGTTTLSSSNSYSGGTTISAGQITAGANGALGSGALSIADRAALNNGSSQSLGAVSFGNSTISGSGTISSGSSFTAVNSGVATVGNVLAGAGVGFTQAGAGTTTLNAANTYTGTTAITNGGTIVLGASASLASTNVYLGTLDKQGTVDMSALSGGYTMNTNQALSGYGIANLGTGTLTINGALTPGSGTNTIGLITVNGGLNLGSTATTTLKLATTGTPGSAYDFLSISGNLIINGQLNLNIIGSYVPTGGDSFQLYSGATTAGAFTGVSLFDSWDNKVFSQNLATAGLWTAVDNKGLQYDFYSLGVNAGTLNITQVPEPADMAYMAGILAASVLYFRRRKSRA